MSDGAVKQFLRDGRLQALHPTEGDRCTFHVDPSEIQRIAKISPGRARELTFVVPSVLLKPTAVFRGLPDRDEKWLCYVGFPDRAYDYRSGQQLPPYDGEIFLVYINARLCVYNWRWETADPIDVNLPCEHKSRYGKRLR